MNPFSAILVLIVSLAGQIFAAETKHTYIGQITCVVCATCEAHISAALIAKLPGMEKIDITKGEKEGTNTITIVSKEGDFTKDTAMSAHGDLSKTYQITSLFDKK